MQFGYHCCRSWEWEQAYKTRGSFRPSFLVSQPVTPGWTVALRSGWAAARRRGSVVIIAAGPSVAKEACKT